MNNTSAYTFQLYYYLLNLRDTLEYTLEHDHPLEAYEQRKTALTQGLVDGSALGNFIKNNGEKGEEIKHNLETLISELYTDESTILHKEANGVRVDYSQNIHIFDLVIGNAEALRDIVYGYISYAKEHDELEQIMTDLINTDEHMYRMIVCRVCLTEYIKSFGEFQKVMSETKGKPSPQSNYIVQNELSKIAGMLRFSRQHTHATDNKTLDILDDVNKLLEMCEGRRERTNNAPFNDLFKGVMEEIDDAMKLFEPRWHEVYVEAAKEHSEFLKERQYSTGAPSPDTSA
ncbi:MAG: hypothetical protein LUC16_01370 [Coprobacillus sp.]|nr:hypothetical protein [Coprobacillus sp.]